MCNAGRANLDTATMVMIPLMLKNAPVVPYIPATNIARARTFYEERVGLVPREEIAGGVVYECGDSEGNILALIQAPK